jgi:acyl-CoA dehydrogenase
MGYLEVSPPSFMADSDIAMFGDAASRFFDRHTPQDRVQQWRDDGRVDADIWRESAEAGILCAMVPEEYGGGGGDFRHEVVLIEQMGAKGIDGFGLTLHNAIVAPYILQYGSEEQKRRWLPRMADGSLITAIAMTEPGTGSDLGAVRTGARRDGNGYVINGQKTFISNGQQANLICVVCKTDPDAGTRGVSLLFVETDEVEGFRRGKSLDKMGHEGQDTSELFFDDVRVPTANLLGPETGLGFRQLMEQLPKERLIIALQGAATMERALAETVEYVKQRQAFGQRIIDFQNTQFKLAEAKTEATIAKVFAYDCLRLLLAGELDATRASMAKYWVSDALCRLVDECLQFFGGYGYINEYPIARMYKDARIQKIYGGANEIMKVLIARSL